MTLFKLYARVLAQLGNEKRLALILVACNLLLAIAAFAEPILFGKIIDKISSIQGEAKKTALVDMLPLIGLWVGFGIFTICAGVMVALHADRMSHRRRLSFMANYFEHVLNLPLSYHSGTHSGRLLKVMLEGSSSISGLLLNFMREHCAAIVTLIVLLPVSLYINWRLGVLLVIMVFFFTILTSFVLRKTETKQGYVQAFHNDLAERATDALGNVPVIQSFTRITDEIHFFRRTIDSLLAAQLPVLSWWAMAAVASRASATLTVMSILVTGIYLYAQGLATVGEIVTFMSFATMLIHKLEAVVGFVNSVFLEAPRIQDFFEVIDTHPYVNNKPNAKELKITDGEVIFDNVSFSYDGKKPAVADLSFKVRKGQTIALVGTTGSGKSTTLSLLHRVFDPQSGKVLIDGVDIREVTLESLRSHIGVVFQEPMLFARTIEENLLVGNPEASENDIWQALERAQAMDFMKRQAEGLKTEIAERGRSLSGGERQRLSIARALLKNPPILILDEATSALDATTEQRLQGALEEVMKGRTTFVIAHRLATIRNADYILVFDKGHVIERGNFEELVALNGIFAALARAQFMADEEAEVT
jgi:ATP-binding cassette, subfamily B, beta-glucan exporter